MVDKSVEVILMMCAVEKRIVEEVEGTYKIQASFDDNKTGLLTNGDVTLWLGR